MKKYLIFDLDGTLIESMSNSVQIIIDTLNDIPDTDFEKVRYIFATTAGTPLVRQLKMVYEDREIDCNDLTEKIYDKLLHLEAHFFPGVIEKIHELKHDYMLFLTTGNSTPTAYKHLQKWGILEYFEIILWSDEIHKGPEHLEIFQNHIWEKDFYKKAVYIWDGDADRMYAQSKEIDFIHIGNESKDLYEIPSVSQIDAILPLLNNKLILWE